MVICPALPYLLLSDVNFIHNFRAFVGYLKIIHMPHNGALRSIDVHVCNAPVVWVDDESPHFQAC
jgi:hypothetical protein